MKIDNIGNKHKHELKGIKYLIDNEYKSEDIKINIIKGAYDIEGNGIPDLITTDNKQWEIKVLQSILSRIVFTSTQFKKFNDNVNILLFKRNGDFLDIIKFWDIKRSINNKNNYSKGIYTYRFIIQFDIDIYNADKVITLLNIINDKTAFLLSGMKKDDIKQFINTHSEAYIKMIIDEFEGLFNFSYTKMLLDEIYNKKSDVIDEFNKNF